jgi:hypothetical protein
MSNTTHNDQFKAKKALDIAMYLTMALSLIVISVFASFSSRNCTTVQITSKYAVDNKFYYQLSSGSGIWSNQEFAVHDSICVPNTAEELAQK